MDAIRIRRWYRLHWLTWLAVIVECAAIVRCHFVEWSMSISDDQRYLRMSDFGWPEFHLRVIETGPTTIPPAPSVRQSSEHQWYPLALSFNLVVWSMLVVSVGFVVETRLRRANRWQFTLRGLGLFVVVVGAMLMLARERASVQIGSSYFGMSPSSALDVLVSRPWEWPVVSVILCGVGCSMWALADWAIRICRRLVRFQRAAASA